MAAVVVALLPLFAIRCGSVPLIPPTETQYGVMIDAGSSGSRAHLFQWKTRRVSILPPPLSVPLTDVAWTEKVTPGISAYWQYPKSVESVLSVLIVWIKNKLSHVRKYWPYYPIYLKATAGLRELPGSARSSLIKVIREFLANNETCPFYFDEVEAARTISGEEEAAYAWTAINYATGALLQYSWGSGTARPKHAFGSLELGGASAQMAFFDPDQDVLANLFKVQVGSQRHWNIYAHSFLHYGHNSARRRMWGALAERAGCFKQGSLGEGDSCPIVDSCLPHGFVYPPYLVPPSSDGEPGITPPNAYSPSIETLIRAGSAPNTSAWRACVGQIKGPLGFMSREESWCMYSHRGQCSFQGVYQPPLPDASGPFGEFFLFGEYHDVWSFLNLTDTSTLHEFRERGKAICSMSFVQLNKYNIALGDSPDDRVPDLPEMCFLAAYTFTMLHKGHGIALDRKMTSRGKVEYLGVKLKIGWPLGAMLYEINTLPWQYEPKTSASSLALSASLANQTEQEITLAVDVEDPQERIATPKGHHPSRNRRYEGVSTQTAGWVTITLVTSITMVAIAFLLFRSLPQSYSFFITARNQILNRGSRPNYGSADDGERRPYSDDSPGDLYLNAIASDYSDSSFSASTANRHFKRLVKGKKKPAAAFKRADERLINL